MNDSELKEVGKKFDPHNFYSNYPNSLGNAVKRKKDVGYLRGKAVLVWCFFVAPCKGNKRDELHFQ